MKKWIYFSKNFKQIVGIILAVIGTAIVIQVVPLAIWIFLLGTLLICLGWFLYRRY